MSVPDEPGLSWAELDELADYAAGVLSGAPAYRIAELVGTDERWAAAYAALSAAEPVVRSALQAAAQVTPAIPDDVAARLEAALVMGPADRSAAPVQRHSSAHTRTAAAPPTRPRSGSGRHARSGPGGREDGRRRRTLTGIAAAVLILAGVGGVAAVARDLWSTQRESTAADMGTFASAENGAGVPDDAAEPPAAAPTPVASPGLRAGAQLLASGTDYQPDTLHQLADLPLPEKTLGSAAAQFDSDDALGRLTAADRLDQCLASVAAIHPGTVTAVDFARFQGEPAAVLLIQHSNSSTVVAVGVDCGVASADVLASVEVG
jgi:hypothetical protein